MILIRLLALLLAASVTFAAPATAGPLVSASALLGAQVVTSSGSDIGHLTDLAVDLGGSQVLYAMVYSDGDSLTGEQVYGVPLASLRRGLQEDTLVLTDRPEAQPPAGEQAATVRATELIGKDVDGRRGARAGEIADLAVDLATGRIEHVLFRPGDAETFRLHLPLSAFEFPAAGNAVLAAAIGDESSSRGK